ncbi:Transmembrane and coiled-coil domains protein 1 [Tetrabaena socialis]|uniref:Transmembrane and coiled-coil domains protein 1 n=1 Tax=Tetrabaena socialis TaxID=47790 RepID=A0A2J8AIT1_9CHLO|nr:Transmembrane and coiled-coil domains protein 1 [Tetrabaena socialis]|eukprot:PNH12427.1 Transmembrane and coiled-coil domains protein 1 [Tetrabaena socialis]
MAMAMLAIVLLSVMVIVLIEILTLLAVSNSPSYKRLVGDIDRTYKELKKLSAAGGATASNAAHKKKERTLEMQLTFLSRDFYYHRMKQFVIMGASLACMLYVLRSRYMGKSVGQLPFVSMFPFSKLTQQWLVNPTPTDCSFMFLYVVCNVGVKPNVSKLMGTQLPESVTKTTDLQSMTSRFSRLATGKSL